MLYGPKLVDTLTYYQLYNNNNNCVNTKNSPPYDTSRELTRVYSILGTRTVCRLGGGVSVVSALASIVTTCCKKQIGMTKNKFIYDKKKNEWEI